MSTSINEHAAWQSLIEGLVRGEYHLLLGAGASRGALGGDNKPLPGASELAEELMADFGLGSARDNGFNLLDAYEETATRNTSLGETRSAYFIRRFTKCKPSWHSSMLRIPWKMVWTLNIDDTLETAAEHWQRDETSRKLITRSWKDPYRLPETNELQCIHLHGLASNLRQRTDELIFSITEYMEAVAERHAWHRVFGDAFLQYPFIIVGARLNDEFDLADCIRRGNQSKQLTGRPSFIVLKEASPLFRERLKGWGLIPLICPAEEFFTHVGADLPREEAKVAGAIPGGIRSVVTKRLGPSCSNSSGCVSLILSRTPRVKISMRVTRQNGQILCMDYLQDLRLWTELPIS